MTVLFNFPANAKVSKNNELTSAANTGSGGGGTHGSANSPRNGYAGGSGIVIIRNAR